MGGLVSVFSVMGLSCQVIDQAAGSQEVEIRAVPFSGQGSTAEGNGQFMRSSSPELITGALCRDRPSPRRVEAGQHGGRGEEQACTAVPG